MNDGPDLREPPDGDALDSDAPEGDAVESDALESARPSDPGGEVLALRFMVNAVEREPPPMLDWERVEARLYARIEAEEASPAREGEVSAASTLELRQPAVAPRVSSRARASAAQPSRAESEASGLGGAATPERSAGASTAAPSPRRASRLGPGERGRSRRGSSKVRARSLGLWAAAAALLVSAAAFAWFERVGARPEPRREAETQSELPERGSTSAASEVGAPSGGSELGESTRASSPERGRAEGEHGAEPRIGAAHADAERRAPHATTQASPNAPSGAASSVALQAGALSGSSAPLRATDGPATRPSVAALQTTSDAELAARVRRCLVERAPHPSTLDEGLERRIESSLRVRVEPDGAVAAVSFHPPLRPELQSCALFVLSLRLGAGPRELSVPIRLD